MNWGRFIDLVKVVVEDLTCASGEDSIEQIFNFWVYEGGWRPRRTTKQNIEKKEEDKEQVNLLWTTVNIFGINSIYAKINRTTSDVLQYVDTAPKGIFVASPCEVNNVGKTTNVQKSR